jgi:hypothetical protein
MQYTKCLCEVIRNILTISFSVLMLNVAAQNGIIEGNVKDAASNEAILFATIQIVGSDQGAISDLDGNYRIENLEPGIYNVIASSVGYRPVTEFEIQVTNVKPAVINFELEEDVQVLDAVVIQSGPTDKTEESPVSLRTIGVSEIKRNPGANRDISLVIQSLPGVASTPSFRNDILIRGGAPNENRFYLDGVEIPNINHFATQGSSGGPVGMINVDFIKEVEFYSGAFPANRGNALSSVFEFEQRDGRTDRWGSTFTVSASELTLTAEGPTGENSSLLLSARRSYLQFLFDLIGLPFLPTFNDFQLKHKVKFSDDLELTIVGLGAVDEFALNLEDDTSAFQQYILGNIPVQTQWNYATGAVLKKFNRNGVSMLVASRNMLNNRSYKYFNNDESNPDNLIFDYNSNEAENKLRYEKNFRLGGYKFNLGANYEYARYTNSTTQFIPLGAELEEVDYSSFVDLHKWGLFGQVSKSYFNELLSLSFGFRADANNYSSSMNNLLEQFSPRFSLSYTFAPGWSFNANTGIYYQLPAYTILGFRNNDGDLVNRDNGLTYIRNEQLVAGVEYRPDAGSRISVEAFYKSYSGYPFSLRDSISLANLGADFGVVGDEPVVSNGEGLAYGVEFLAQQKLKKGFYGIVAYTLVVSEFEDRNGDLIPSAWDSRHIVALTGGKEFRDNWQLGVKWRFLSGQPFTPFDVPASSLIPIWDISGQGIPDYTRLNTQRLNDTHQLDLRIDKKWFFDRLNLNVFLDVQNVYNFQTQLQPILDVVKDYNGQPLVDPEDPSRYQTYFLENPSGSILPSIGLIVEI